MHGYQVPASGVSAGWQPATAAAAAYYMQPAVSHPQYSVAFTNNSSLCQGAIPGGAGIDSMLGAQLGQLQISGTGYAASHQPPTQYHMPPTGYPAPGGWGIPHATPSIMTHGQVC